MAGSFVVSADPGIRWRRILSNQFKWLCRASVYALVLVLLTLFSIVVWKASSRLNLSFFRHGHSFDPNSAGIQAGVWGSFWLVLLTICFSMPIGIGTAIYLEEFARDTRITRIIKVNLANLAGVPSIVYGMLGLTVFVRMFELFDPKVMTLGGFLRIPMPFGKTVIAGALTLTLVILPVVIVASQEALRAVPRSIREASYALGATRWQTIWRQILPASLPGIATGAILSISRAIGETAPLVMVGAITDTRICPGGIRSLVDILRHPGGVLNAPFSQYSAMPIVIYHWIGLPGNQFESVAAAGIVVLISLLLMFNGIAVWIRHRARRRIQW